MKIGGLLKFSLIDYPGKMAAVIFTQGCNFHCPYCHNSELVNPESFCDPIPDDDILDFLKKRVGQIEGLVITGGEPTLQGDLIEFLQKVKHLGYPVKLDTNGSNPDVLRDILRLNLADYIAMDIKVPLEKYSQLTSIRNCDKFIKESIDIILGSGLAHEFRTTLAAPVVLAEDLPSMVSLIKGAKKYRLQRFILRDNVLNKKVFEDFPKSFSKEDVADLQSKWGIGGD